MRNPARISLALGTSAALLSLAALPASAAEENGGLSSESNTTVTVDSGTLSISVAPKLETAEKFKPGTAAEILVPAFTVTDNRAGKAGWSVAVEMTNFTGQDDISDETIDASLVTYKPAMVGEVGGEAAVSLLAGIVTFEAGKGTEAVSATDVHGNNSASWNGTLTVPVPANALAGTYAAVLTHSFL